MITGQKHILSCRCILSQHRSMQKPPQFSFVIFSTTDENGFHIKYVQCPNCGVVHKVTDFCTSEIVHGKESLVATSSIDEIRLQLPANLALILDMNKADLPTWESAKFIIDNEKWNSYISLSTEIIEKSKVHKVLLIKSFDKFLVETIVNER